MTFIFADGNLELSSENDVSSEREKSESPDSIQRKQSFIRNDQKRRVICHRRVPSAPSTPRQDETDSQGGSVQEGEVTLDNQISNRDKSVSQPALDCKPPRSGTGKQNSGHVQQESLDMDRFYVHTIMPPSVGDLNRNGDDNGSEKRKGSKTPPKDRKKLKEGKDKSPSVEMVWSGERRGSEKENVPCDSQGIIAELPESPGCRRKLWNVTTTSSREEHSTKNTAVTEKYEVNSPYVIQRYHDYAEIDESQMIENFESHVSSKTVHEESVVNTSCAIKSDSDQTRYYRVESIDNMQKRQSQSESIQDKTVLETDFPTEVTKHVVSDRDFMSEINEMEQGIHSIQPVGKSMTKCVSIPADIQKSLENIRSHSGSHSDIMSSVTISELSMSQENVFGNNDGNGAYIERRRRSTSLDGLNDESPLSRTLKEINAQIDKAFKSERHKAQTLKEMQAAHRACQKQTSVESELESYNDELCATPTGHRSFGSMRDSERTFGSRSSLSDNHTRPNTGAEAEHNKFVDRPAAEIHIAESPKVIRGPSRSNHSGQTNLSATTPTRPSPPASLDIACPTTSSGPQPHHTDSPLQSPYTNVPSKTGFRMSEEDFQKSLMSDPESLKHFEQSMMYSPVRARSKAFPDVDKSARSSIASPFESVTPRSRSNRSSVTSPDASPASFRGQALNRSFGSPESSPLASRPPRSQGAGSQDSSPQPQLKHGQSLCSIDSSPKSRQRSKLPVPTSAETSPTARQKLNQSYSSSEGSPQARQKQNLSFSSLEGSPQSSRQKLNQSFSSMEASPPSKQKQNQSFSSSDSSPQVRHQKLNQSASSSEASPQSARSKSNQSWSSVENSPQTGRQRIGSCESSPQAGQRQLGVNYGSSSPQVDIKRFGQSPRSSPRSGSHHDRRSFIVPLPKMEQRKGGSLVSSPLSPEHKQPRWEDLAGLNEFNDSFNEIDMAVFNDNWKKCLAPTGDSIRKSNTGSETAEQQNEYPEVSTGTDTVVLERPSITRKTTNIKSPTDTTKEVETYDNVSEHDAVILTHGAAKNEKRRQAGGRPMIMRSHTVPEASSVSQSPTATRAGMGPGFLEHSSSFESTSTMTGHYLSGDHLDLTDHSGVKKSGTKPTLQRQTSFDSAFKKSVKVTSLGSSFEESDAERVAANMAGPGYQGSYMAMTSSERSQSEFGPGGGLKKSSTNQSSVTMSARQSSQSSVLIRSESTQSTDYSYGDQVTNQSVGPLDQPSNQSSVGTLLPQMLEEMDVNESCLGLASHQNMSNEMKEMMQEQMKEHAGILSPLDEVMAPFSGITSPRSNQRSFFDASHPFLGFDMESSIELPSDIGHINLPEIHLQYLSDGPTVIATPNVLSQLNYNPPVHQPIDNTEEAFQNAINDDLERNLASLQQYLPHHVKVCEPDDKCGEESCDNSRNELQDSQVDRPGQNPGLEHLIAITADSVTVMDTPPPVMQDSMSSSTSSQVDLMSTSFTYPQNFDSWHYHSPMVNSLSIQGDLAPPPLEMIEICKSVLVRSKPPSGRKKASKPKDLHWEYPKIIGQTDGKKRTSKSEGSQDNVCLDRGEEKLVLDNRPCLKKHGKGESGKQKPQSVKMVDMVDSDHGENSEDDVFVDPSEVTPETSFFAAGSKYFRPRDCLSYGHVPQTAGRLESGHRDNRIFSFDLPPRTSLDETLIGINGQRLASNEDNLLSNFTGEFSMDICHQTDEDIRFSKAHRSSKLLTLCEKFETSQGQQQSDGETPESEKKKTITPPEKNLVSSIRQMHESLEKEKGEMFGKPQRVRKVSLEEEKVKLEELSVITTRSPSKESSFSFSTAETCQRSPTGLRGSKELPSPQGKPPRYKGKARTPSESSLSETEGAKSTGKPKTDGSPKSRFDGSPKGQRQSQVDESSSKLLPHSGSPKGQRYSTEISPKLVRGKESPTVMPKHGGSPTLTKSSESGSKIPVFRQNSFSKDDGLKPEPNSSPRYGSSPKGSRHSWSSVEGEFKGKKDNNDSSDQNVKLSRIPQAEMLGKTDSANKTSNSGQKLREKSDKEKAEKKKRRGSIKELTNIFEEKIESLGKSASSQSPTPVKLRSRVRSVSPNSALNKSPTPPGNVRHSMELPRREPMPANQSDSAGSKSAEGAKYGSVRMGPKPFYGAK